MNDKEYINRLRMYGRRIQISVHRLDTLEGLAEKSIDTSELLLKEIDSLKASFSDLIETIDDDLSSIKIGLTD